MKQTDKNIIMVTAGGVGERFGSSVPKQSIEVNGRKVISYVIEACKQSQLADARRAEGRIWSRRDRQRS